MLGHSLRRDLGAGAGCSPLVGFQGSAGEIMRIIEMLHILVKHQVNFSVENFVWGSKVRVKQSSVWDRDGLMDRTVFKELRAAGFKHELVKFHNPTSDRPAATVEYHFGRQG